MTELDLEKEGGVRGATTSAGATVPVGATAPADAFDNTAVFARVLGMLRDAGGGVLTVPPGVWHTGPIDLFSGTTLHLEEGAVLSFIPEPDRYQPVFTRWEGVECHAMHPCVFSAGQHDVAITGRGTLDGNGRAWWNLRRDKARRGQTSPELPIEIALASLNPGYASQPGGGGGRELQFLRPPLVQFYNCRDIRLEGITLKNSPFWTVHPVYCNGVAISGVTIENPHDAPNTDGIDIDSSSNVEITDTTVNVGDDGIALKSGSGPDGIRVNRPTSHVTVRNCTVGNGHGGIVIGSETAAGVHDVLAENCAFRGTDRGIRIKTRRGRGGVISDLVFRNLVMEGSLCPLAINMYYRCGTKPGEPFLFSLDPEPVTGETPHVGNVTVSSVRATGCRASAGFIAGLPESPVTNLSIRDCLFEVDMESAVTPAESDMFEGIPAASGKGFRILNADNPELRDVIVKGPSEPFIGI